MKANVHYLKKSVLCFIVFLILACNSSENQKIALVNIDLTNPKEVKIEVENFTNSSGSVIIEKINDDLTFIESENEGWLALDVNIPTAGRYKLEIHAQNKGDGTVNCWIEDYYDNKDERQYNITGNISFENTESKFITLGKDGSPLNSGLHRIKLHYNKSVIIDWVKFSLIKKHDITPKTYLQKTVGKNWKIVWSDEFEDDFIDTSKWTYDIGNWGWGNGEEQYYTKNRTENARIENGNLIIEARKNDMGNLWTSARLTTRGKASFLYGKIEFRAKVPHYKGNWAAGWLLGDEYVDELSWPYCGEIDILESVGYEMDDETGKGIAHASANSGGRYFKLGNQPTNTVEVLNMNNEFHTYAVEWTHDSLKVLVDDNHYFTYSDTSSEMTWPFSKPQNIILNLTIGGGWGGYYGIDENTNSQKMLVDYVRVYELQ